jgi:hypothetical protein
MGSVRLRAGRQRHGREEPPPLPLRWAVILLAAAMCGYLGWIYGGPLAGGGVAVAVTGLLHQILP